MLIYGFALATGAVALQWLEYQIWARAHPGTVYVALVAAAFLGLGIWVGRRLFRNEPRAGEFTANERAQASLGITERERQVLQLLADGRSNKEIAARLGLSPNTVKTHVRTCSKSCGLRGGPRRSCLRASLDSFHRPWGLAVFGVKLP